MLCKAYSSIREYGVCVCKSTNISSEHPVMGVSFLVNSHSHTLSLPCSLALSLSRSHSLPPSLARHHSRSCTMASNKSRTLKQSSLGSLQVRERAMGRGRGEGGKGVGRGRMSMHADASRQKRRKKKIVDVTLPPHDTAGHAHSSESFPQFFFQRRD
jgi:hypothetical protein